MKTITWPIHSLTDDHDPHIQAWIKNLVKESDTFYDIGANTGIMSRIAKSLGAVVCVIEPNPTSLAQLLDTSIVDYYAHCGLWDKPTTLHLHFPTLEHSAQTEVYDEADKSRRDYLIEVPGLTLDILTCHLNWPLPDIIKSDTQGSEVRWLRGAADSLWSCRAMILEIYDPMLKAHGNSEEELLYLVDYYGFRVEDRVSNDILVVRSNL